MSRSRAVRQFSAPPAIARMAIATAALLLVSPLVTTSPAVAAPSAVATVGAEAVDLGSAAGYSVLAGTSITNTGASVLALDLGVTGTLAGFPPGVANGEIRVGTPEVETAHADRQAAYDAVVAQPGGTAFGGDLAGTTFTPGLYSAAAAVTNTGIITLDAEGDPNALFVFKVGAALSSAAATKVVLTDGALAHNVYWQAVGAVSLGAGAKWVGTILGAGAVSFGEAASLKGRALTPSTLALASTPVTQPIDDLVAPVVAINGGPARSTNDTTPSISGTTDEPGTPLVTVTIGSQTLTRRASAGTWTLSADALTQGPHDVVASVTDPSGNTGTAAQELTVDTVAPSIAVTGGASRFTSDTTPTISGTTGEAGTPAVSVEVSGQTLTTTASGGAWTVQAATLTETAHSVAVSVDDAAGNTGASTQVLTVDATVPVLTIDGGASRSTVDTSPWIYGTTAEKSGTTVHVALGTQSLSATVQPGGTWGVSAETLPAGTYTVLASITDDADNTGTATQSLQVGSVRTDLVVAIDGGPARDTNDPTPTISGTTGEAGTPTVTVTVSGQTLTATAVSGDWSVQAATLAEGSHTVYASIDTGSGTGTASQTLKVDMTAPVVTIDGGATRSTTDSTPRLQGTTSEPAGTTVQVIVGDQLLVAEATAAGTWGVDADTLAAGSYEVVASSTDAAQNTGTAAQALTIVLDAPVIPPTVPAPTPTPTPTPTTVPPTATPQASIHRPDAAIRRGKRSFIGAGSYHEEGQRVTSSLRDRVKSVTFEVRVTNEGTVAEPVQLVGTKQKKPFKVTYLVGDKNVTAAVMAGTYRTVTLRVGESSTLTIRATRLRAARKGSKMEVKIRAVSTHSSSTDDTVYAVVKVTG